MGDAEHAERARAQLTREIKEEARRQVAAGARAAALAARGGRELGMVSSALYRYYPSRDELLTALIIDAYESLGGAAEAAVAGAEADERPRSLAGLLPGGARLGPGPAA